jgi:colanic acid biosynthesis glycosyl transferase WcaI
MLRSKTLLIISQTFVPDPASVGQHMADVAIEMARRGYRVKVYTSARGYENPSVKYAKRENLHGVEIHRLGLASFGKKSIFLRILGTASFMMQSIFLCLFTPRLGGIFFSTSPPLIGIAATIAHKIRRVPIAYWAMDLNPDQLIAMGKLKPTDFTARVLEKINRIILSNSSLIVALDRFMAGRLRQRADVDSKMQVMPPWPHEEHLEPLPHEENPFRSKHNLGGKFVIMYSGNHSPGNPLRTLLDATLSFKDDSAVQFLFIGGGLGKREVEEHIAAHSLTNVISLPYQPLGDLRYSLSAADVHVVSLGEDMVGIVHPCKIYGAMTVGRPILFFGPRPSHVSDILERHNIGLHVMHGNVAGAIDAISSLRALGHSKLAEMGALAQRVMQETLSQEVLCNRFCDYVEISLKLKRLAPAPVEPQTSTAPLR